MANRSRLDAEPFLQLPVPEPWRSPFRLSPKNTIADQMVPKRLVCHRRIIRDHMGN